MGRRKSCSLLSPSPLFLVRVVSSCLFLFFSILYFSFLSRLSSRSWCMCIHPVCTSVYTERGEFRRSALYLRRASTSNGFDVLGRNAYLSRAECVCTHACVGRFLMRACARVFSVHTRARSRSRATRDTARREDGGKDSRIHTRTSRTGVNYASREMSNCSPYHKIYNSARCGKHYVLSRFFSSPPLPFYLQPPGVPTIHPPIGPSSPSSRPRFSPPRGHHDSQINSRGAPQSY